MKSFVRNTVVRVIRRAQSGAAAARWLGVTVGAGSRVLSLGFGSEPWLVSIGDRVTVSGGVQFLTHDGAGWLCVDDRGRRFRYAPVRVGNDVFIGYGSIILPGVTIGSRCVIGAGSIVTRSVPDGSVVAGNPARYVRSYESLMRDIKKWPAEADVAGLEFRAQVDAALNDAPAKYLSLD